jgi:hypothetical protein
MVEVAGVFIGEVQSLRAAGSGCCPRDSLAMLCVSSFWKRIERQECAGNAYARLHRRWQMFTIFCTATRPLGIQKQTARQKRFRPCCTQGGPRLERAKHPLIPYLVPSNCARYCVGDWPRIFLNTRLKCVNDWNPTSKAISLTRRFGFRSRFLDFSMRTRPR